MSATKHTIKIDAEVVTQLKGMSDVVAGLQKGLKEGATKVDLSKGVGASLSKSIAAFEKDYARIQKLTEGGAIQLGDAKEFTKKGQHLLSIFEDLQRVIGNFDDMQLLDAKKLFPEAFDKKVSDLRASLAGLSEGFDKLSTKSMNKQKLVGEIGELEADIKTLQATASKETEFKVSSDKAQAELKEANDKVAEIRESLKQEFKLKIDADLASEKEMKDQLKAMKEQFEQTKKNVEVDPSGKRVARYKGFSTGEWRRKKDSPDKTAALAALQQYEKEKKAIEELEGKISELASRRQEMSKAAASVDSGDLVAAASALGKTREETKEVTDALQEQKTATEAAANAANDLAKAQKAAAEAGEKQAQLEAKQKKLASVLSDIEKLTKQTNLSAIVSAFNKLNAELEKSGKGTINLDLTEETLKSEDGIEKLKAELDKLDQEDLNRLKTALKEIGFSAEDTKDNVRGMGQVIDQVDDSAKSLTQAQKDVENLKDSVLRFFSLTNAVQIFKNTIRDAFKTVKELDAAMTETAVVTDFSIGDMWDKLPEYSAQATQLGASIKELYNATTLYYQQGLNSQQAMDVGIETMKMARIAGMDATEATTAMTAALRGFNMEINEMSATRINDVYSELAAITAADTNQIATAMKKTASIAASANMEFENTAALLAQIIETTQEAPETAGTAMKTIIARFTEIKQLFSEGMLTGEDEEGEEININKIDAALKSVGISLKDFLNGTKGIDDIFLELASKWDSLDLATQRYIATTAAGSRQQSRFLAMMSNYDRTMELVNAATNSAGASQKQFGKTLESLDAKLQRLENAWAEFTMGLVNNELIKFGVDLLTDFVTVINKVTEALPGVTGNIAKLLLTIGGLKAGGAIFDTFFQNLKKVGPDAMGPFQALTNSVSTNFLTMKTNIGGVFEKIKSMGGLGGTIKTLASSFFGLGKGVEATTMATLGFNGALAACPIGWVILAIAALIAAIYGIAKAWQAASDSFKLDAINESINQMTSNIEGAKQAIEDLKSSKNSLQVLQKEFSNLTKGTQEWKEKLIETNQQVLDLLDKYPELSAYITKTDFGSLNIKSEGWDTLLAAQESALKNTANARIGMQYMRSDLQEKMDYEELLTSTIGENFGEAIDGETIGSVIGTTASGIIEQGLGGIYGAYAGIVLGSQWGKSNEKAIQNVFGEASEWGTQAMLDVAGFLDTGWGKVVVSALGNLPTTIGIAVTDALNGEDSLEESAQRILGAGYTQNEMSELLAALGEAGVTFDDGSFSTDRGTIEGILSELGFETSFEQVTALAQKLGSSFNELTLSAQQYALAKDGQRDGLMANALANSSIAQQDYADSIGYLLGETIYENIEPMLEQKKGSLTNNKKELKQLYEKEVGGFYENGKLYSDSTMSTEWDLSVETMKSAIASAQVAKDMGVSVEAMATVISDLSSEQQKIFTELFSREGAAINSGHFDNYMTPEGIDLTKVLEDMGFQGEDAFKQFVEKFGTEAGELLLDNFNMAADRITKARVDLAKKMRRSNKKGAGEFASEDEYIANELKRLEDKFGYGIRDTLNSVFATLNETGDQALVDAGYQKFMEVSETGSLRDLEDIENFISDVDWKNPIQAVKQLNHEVKYGSKITSEYAKTLLEVGSSAFDGGAQMRYLLKSADFTDMSEDIEKIIEQQGELSAMDVLDLADSYEELNDIMENTGVTAAGLAELLEKIANEEISADKVTDVVMAALEGFESLDTYVAKVLKNIEDFDWGVNENDVNDFIGDAWDNVVLPNVEAGSFNNSQLNKWMELMAGVGWDKGMTGSQRKDTIVSYAQELKKYTDAGNFAPFWKRVAADQNLLGQKSTVDTSAGSKYEGLDVKANADGSYTLVGYEGKDITTIESYLAEVSGSMEMAKMALVDMRQQNADRTMDDYFTQQDIDKALKAALDEAESTRVMARRKPAFDTGEESAVFFEERKIVDKSEIDAIVALYGEEYRNAIENYFDPNSIVITNFYDEKGALNSIEEIVTELDKAFSPKKGAEVGAKWIEGFASRTKDGKAIINWDQVMKGLADANVPEQIRTQVGEAMLGAFNEEVETTVTVTLSDGTPEEIKVTPEIDIETAIANAERQMELGYLKNTISDAIKEAFNIDDFKVNFTKTSAAELTKAVEDAVPDEVPTTVNYVMGSTAGLIDDRRITTYVDYVFGEDDGLQGIVDPKEHAKGIKNSPNSHIALVSEEGPELIQTEGGFYLTGQNGPELAYINKGDTVYTAEETEDILKKKNRSIMPRFAGGITGYGSGVSLSGGANASAKSDDDKEDWENPFDKLYNLVREISEELRQRNRLERRYEKLLQSTDVTAGKLFENSVEQLKQLEKEKLLQKELQESRRQQIAQYQQENSDLLKYAKIVQNERGEDVLRIHWDQINLVENPEQGQRIEDYVGQLEEWMDGLNDIEDELNDIEDRIEEVKELGKDEYLDLENALKKAVEFSYQEEIDKLSQIDESINDTNDQLIGAIRSQINKIRQQRDNEKTEQELQDKQRQLLYLSQDTSGANDLAILELQKEIDEGTQDYTDTLIDQKIDELEEQNEKAAEQREQQIQLLQAQLDYLIITGGIWEEVYDLMDEGLDPEVGLVRGSKLEEMLKNAEGFMGMSKIQQMDWLKELQQQAAQAVNYMRLTTEKIDTAVELNKQNYFGPTTSEPSYSGSSSGSGGSGGSGSSGNSNTTPNPNPQPSHYYARSTKSGSIPSYSSSEKTASQARQSVTNLINEMYNYLASQIRNSSASSGEKNAELNILKNYKNNAIGSISVTAKYKKGGLADFTGPAWLDGTKSRPELVLNARDTQNFIQLKDILASIMSHGNTSNTSTENNGDITYDIDINVESIGNDYDVEQVANKVKSLINEDARYRNNNAISLKR